MRHCWQPLINSEDRTKLIVNLQVACLHGFVCTAVNEQLEGLNLNTQLREVGKQAEVLGKQAASNLKKGFGAFVQGAKELSAKAQAEISRRSNRPGQGSDGGLAETAAFSSGGRQPGKQSEVHGTVVQAGRTQPDDDDELL